MEPRSVWTWDNRTCLGLGVLAFSLVMSVYTWRADSAIAAREGTAQGIITAHQAERFFEYEYGYVFFVNGQWFTGWGRQPKNSLEIGMQVLVYYDSQNP
jgi:hypothetical protein